MKKQVIFIHGGDVFNSYSDYIEALNKSIFNPNNKRIKKWKDSLAEEIGDNFDVIAPTMPNKQNAKYNEWRIWFEKIFPHLGKDIILVGYSLGGIFLAKYLSENIFPKKILVTYLISAPYNGKHSEYFNTDFVLADSLEKMEEQSEKIFLYHSEDDAIVSFVDLKKYSKVLPKAVSVVFKDRSHFLQEKFPELVKSIKSFS